MFKIIVALVLVVTMIGIMVVSVEGGNCGRSYGGMFI